MPTITEYIMQPDLFYREPQTIEQYQAERNQVLIQMFPYLKAIIDEREKAVEASQRKNRRRNHVGDIGR